MHPPRGIRTYDIPASSAWPGADFVWQISELRRAKGCGDCTVLWRVSERHRFQLRWEKNEVCGTFHNCGRVMCNTYLYVFLRRLRFSLLRLHGFVEYLTAGCWPQEWIFGPIFLIELVAKLVGASNALLLRCSRASSRRWSREEQAESITFSTW